MIETGGGVEPLPAGLALAKVGWWGRGIPCLEVTKPNQKRELFKNRTGVFGVKGTPGRMKHRKNFTRMRRGKSGGLFRSAGGAPEMRGGEGVKMRSTLLK